MDDRSTRKAELLRQIDETRALWDGLLVQAEDVGFERPGAAGDWTFRDVAAHLNGWRERTLLRLEAARENREPAPSPWPAGLDSETEDGVDAINDWFYERARGRPADEVIAESRAQLSAMRDLVAAIPADDLFATGRYSWLGNYAIADVAFGSLEHLHEEHMPAIRAWLADAGS